MSVPLLRARRQSSRPASFAAISKEVDPENEDLILHRRERLIPWSKSPFFDKLTVEYRKLREERRQSSYHGDASTPVPGRHAETYAGMLTADEIKDVDKSNDEERGEPWASTFANLTQNNMISGEFDVTAFVGSDDKDPVQKALDDFNDVTPNQQLANDLAEQRIPEVSFFGIALVIGISRVLLCIQYIRVWLYAHDKRDPAVVVKPLAMFISAGLWCGSFAMLFTARYTNNAAHISKFIMWGVATAIEVAGHYFAPPAGHLRSMGSLTARLATLVTIILGEGLNGITGTLKFAATSLGFNFRCVALVLCTAVVVYLQPLNILQILYTSLEFTITKFTTFLNDANQGDPSQMIDTLNKTMTPFLAKIGFSWDDGWKHVMETAGSGTQDEFENLFVAVICRNSKVMSNRQQPSWLSFNTDVLDVNLPEFGVNHYGRATCPRCPVDQRACYRYAWGSAISRFLNGTILLTLLFMNVEYLFTLNRLDSFWALPTLAFSLLAQAIVDHMLLVLAVRSADRALQRTYEPSMLDPLRDSKDHAYDPPQPSGASIATTYPPTPGTGGYKNTQSNWQPPYVPHTQQHPVYASPSEMGHQSSHGFVAPPPPPTLPFQATGGTGIPPGGIVTPSRPR
ncbi:hypothetical protein AG1IA_04702 [Rhizoctonia solani AG-1 IA]|uniref:Uncharacterized protein n=1 Tax=Thanatephorus cucumeris (strain AG1-IA) TaxID=983506 RepID=L8WWW7_THACA|nr:hypothetical protein AG1IA_04702 [Rhizoctonia solani AG-1 IA]